VLLLRVESELSPRPARPDITDCLGCDSVFFGENTGGGGLFMKSKLENVNDIILCHLCGLIYMCKAVIAFELFGARTQIALRAEKLKLTEIAVERVAQNRCGV